MGGSATSDQDAAAAASGFGAASWTALGTGVRLLVTEAAAVDPARDAVESVLADVDLAASRFREDSELNRLAGRPGEWVRVSPLLLDLLGAALRAAAESGGLLDPTVGEALAGLGYDRTFRMVAPEGGELVVSWPAPPGAEAIEIDEPSGRVRLRPGTRLDLGATAKGAAADLAATAAQAAAGCGVLVSLGGDMAAAGPPPPAGWAVRVGDSSDPDAPGDGPSEVVAVHRGGLATSSTRVRRWVRGGRALHHIVDPRTGLPAGGPWRTVSVTAATCLQANVASTTAVILGEDAPAWLTRRQLPARLVNQEGEVLKLGGWP